MKKTFVLLLTLALVPACTFAVDGVVLINQSTVMAAGGFPYVIRDHGSYKLSGNLTVTTTSDAIDINADDVTLDLNGFSIVGSVTCSGSPPVCSASAANGVLAVSHQNVTVKSGIVRGFSRGVQIVGGGASGGLIADLQASGNSDYGIYAVDVVIVRCSANNNGGYGMAVVNGTVSDSTANRNRFDGFTPYGSTFIHNAANDNGRYGIAGVLPSYPFLFGSNTFLNNKTSDAVGGTSQNNNLSSAGPC